MGKMKVTGITSAGTREGVDMFQVRLQPSDPTQQDVREVILVTTAKGASGFQAGMEYQVTAASAQGASSSG